MRGYTIIYHYQTADGHDTFQADTQAYTHILDAVQDAREHMSREPQTGQWAEIIAHRMVERISA